MVGCGEADQISGGDEPGADEGRPTSPEAEPREKPAGDGRGETASNYVALLASHHTLHGCQDLSGSQFEHGR